MTGASQESQESQDSEKPGGSQAPDQPHKQQHPIPGRRRRWGRIVAIGAILLLGPALWFGVRPMLGMVTVDVTDVISWYGYSSGQFPWGTEVRLLLHNPFGNDIADMEVFIDRWTDDHGKNLLIRSVPTGGEVYRARSSHTYDFMIYANGGMDLRSTNGVPMAGGRAGASKETQVWITSPVDASADSATATVAGRAVVIFGGKWWNRRVEVPFEVTKPLKRKDASYMCKDVVPIPVTPVPDSAWGPKGDGRAEDLFQLSAMAWTGTTSGPNQELSSEFHILCLDPRTFVSYNVTLTGCYDDEGNKLLGGLPARSAVGEHWRVCEVWRGPDNMRAMPFFTITTNQLPVASAKCVTFEGLIRLKLGDGEESIELKDIPLDPDKPFNVGSLELRVARNYYSGIVGGFVTRGAQGMLRRMIIESDAGEELTYGEYSPRTYWTNTWWMACSCPDGAKKLTIEGTKKLTVKATYLTRQWHYDLPFKITVPLNAPNWTVMKSGPTSARSRPAGK